MGDESEATKLNTYRSHDQSAERTRMHLMTPQKWVEKYFDDGSRPSEMTVRRWLSTEKLPGRKIGGTWYVDEHAWLADGDELVLRVLNHT